MNAQKLKNGQIAIGNNSPRKDAVEIIQDLRVSEFYRLVRCTKNWSSQLNDRRDVMFAMAPEESKLRKEFDYIYNKRKLFNERENTPLDVDLSEKKTEEKVIKRYTTKQEGTARLVYVKSKQTVLMLKRKTKEDNYNKENSVCISNDLREEFFKESKSLRKYRLNKFEIRKSDSEELFNKWTEIIKKIYEEGLSNANN